MTVGAGEEGCIVLLFLCLVWGPTLAARRGQKIGWETGDSEDQPASARTETQVCPSRVQAPRCRPAAISSCPSPRGTLWLSPHTNTVDQQMDRRTDSSVRERQWGLAVGRPSGRSHATASLPPSRSCNATRNHTGKGNLDQGGWADTTEGPCTQMAL